MWGFGEQDQGSSATCIISKLYYQHEVYVKFLYYKITPFHPSHTVFFRRKSLCTADTWVKSYSAPWKWIIYINYLEFFYIGNIYLIPSNLSIQFFISICAHRHLFCTLNYKAILLIWFFFPQMVSALDIGSSLSWLLYPLLWGFVCFGLIFIFWALPYLLDCEVLQDHLVDLALEPAISPRSSSSFYWEWY